jgi:PadR family transcriptional regulator
MRRKPGGLVPLEAAIIAAAAELHASGVAEFHGYQLAKHLGASDHRRLTAYGTLYRALARLESMDLLRSRWEDPQIAADENRPGRRLYALTGAGEFAANAARNAPAPRAGRRRSRRRPATA